MTHTAAPPVSLPPAASADTVRLIAYYLPQFHPIPENDVWWGKGFTEWTNTAKAEPLYPGHYQPHLPADLGFYDLRLRQTRREQIQMAKEYGIDGFCYHYYWFSGKRLLEQPLEDMLADEDSDMPFCLCWANENWTRRWNGGENDILIEQKYAPEDALHFVQDITPYLLDHRYIRVDGRPLLIVYRPQQIPDIRNTVNAWRHHFREQGVGEVHLCAALTHSNLDYEQFGFDGGVEFPPHNRALLGVKCINGSIRFHEPFHGCAMMFNELGEAYLRQDHSGRNIFRGVFPSWDNTARTGSRALFFLNGTPGNYEYWLSKTIERTQLERPGEDRLVFINAWNEWAEGCHLEPDQQFGRAFLDATLRAKRGETTQAAFPDTELPAEATANLSSFLEDMGQVFRRHTLLLLRRGHERVKGVLARNPRLKRFLKALFFWY